MGKSKLFSLPHATSSMKPSPYFAHHCLFCIFSSASSILPGQQLSRARGESRDSVSAPKVKPQLATP